MEEDEFTLNGVSLARLSEYQSKIESRFVPPELCCSGILYFVGSLAIALYLHFTIANAHVALFAVVGCLVVGAIGVGACMSGFAEIAGRDGKLPTKYNNIPAHKHITGLGAAIALAVLLFVVVTTYAGEHWHSAFVIPEWVGQSIIFGIFAIFLAIQLSSKFSTVGSLGRKAQTIRSVLSPLAPLGRWLSRLDSWLVFLVAPLVGATQRNLISRYGVLFLHIGAASGFAWFGPAPLGLIGTLWTIVIVVAVNRRWSWIESERSRSLNDPLWLESSPRIEIEQDLRDEAIWSILCLMIILPIGMRQVDLSFEGTAIFRVERGARDSIDAWTGFFGVELLKALPFLDWADIYDVTSKTRVSVDSSISMHALLIARAIIDLVFIGSLIQAISISISLARNRRDFLDQKPGIDKLDERIEGAELSSLAVRRAGKIDFKPEISKFLHYNTRRLSLLRSKSAKGSKLNEVITEIFRLAQYKYEPPIELLVHVTGSKHPKPAELGAVLNELEKFEDFDLTLLAVCRRKLNWKAGLESERQRLVSIILNKVELSAARDKELAEILIGTSADSLNSVRVLVVQALAKNATRNADNIRILSEASHFDRSKAVRDKAKRAMRQYSIVAIPIDRLNPVVSATAS